MTKERVLISMQANRKTGMTRFMATVLSLAVLLAALTVYTAATEDEMISVPGQETPEETTPAEDTTPEEGDVPEETPSEDNPAEEQTPSEGESEEETPSEDEPAEEPEEKPEGTPEEKEPYVQVGIYYGDNAAISFNLQNVNDLGSGYTFGYYDSDLNFVPLAETEEVCVSVLKTHNIYLDANGGYTTTATGRDAVGCFHVQLPGEYADYESAKIAADEADGFVAYINGVFYVRVGSYVSRTAAQAAAAEYEGAVLGETSSFGLSITVTKTNRILFQFDDEGNGTGLGIWPKAEEGIHTQTWCKGNRYYGGFRYERVNGGNIVLVSVLDMDDYISCVISREMSESWPLEALKAQAVCARTYYASARGRHKGYNFDVCGGVHCQSYYGASKTGPNTDQAAAETHNQYLWYEGTLCTTYYYASNGGATENSNNVWTASIPYLVGVVDPYERTVSDKISKYNWSYSFGGTELQAKLIKAGYANCGVITSVSLTSTKMGNVLSISFHDANGKTWTLHKEKCRTVLGVPSMRFGLEEGPGHSAAVTGGVFVNNGEMREFGDGIAMIDGNGNITVVYDEIFILTDKGLDKEVAQAVSIRCNTTVTSSGPSFQFNGSGSGHNVGMSQWGANAMAKLGYNYEEILTFYYTGASLG